MFSDQTTKASPSPTLSFDLGSLSKLGRLNFCYLSSLNLAEKTLLTCDQISLGQGLANFCLQLSDSTKMSTLSLYTLTLYNILLGCLVGLLAVKLTVQSLLKLVFIANRLTIVFVFLQTYFFFFFYPSFLIHLTRLAYFDCRPKRATKFYFENFAQFYLVGQGPLPT